MLKDFFSNRLFIGALAFFILCVAGSLLYQQHVKRQSVRELAETQERIKVLTEKQNPKPTAEVPEGDTSQGGHFHADGTWKPGEPHEMPSDEKIESDTEFKPRVEKEAAELAAAKTAREQNEALMRYMEASPDFHGQENYYNFLKAHPDFDYATASPELKQKCRDALNADTAKIRAEAEQFEKETAEYERNRKHVDKSPWIPPQGGNR